MTGSRSVVLAVGLFALIGDSAAWAQGAMTPPRVDVAPPPRTAPVSPTVTVPTTPPTTPTVIPTAPPAMPTLPSAGTQGTPRSTGPAPGTSSGIFDRWGNALAGVGVSWSGPGGPRTAVSDGNGAVSLGRLPAGVHELTVNTRTTSATGAGNQPQPQQILIGLLLPAIQKLGSPVAVETAVPANSGDRRIRIGVDAKGQVTSVDLGDGKGAINVAAGDFNGDGRPDLATGRRQYEPLLARSDQTHIVFGSSASGPASPAGFATNLGQNPVNGVGGTGGGRFTYSVKGKGPGGVFDLRTDSTGVARLGVLPVGTTELEISGDDLRSAVSSGSSAPTAQKVQAGVVIGVLAALKTNGEPVASVMTFPANAIPKSVKVSLRVGRDGNLMDLNWGQGPQAVLVLGNVAVSAGTFKVLQETAQGAQPGEIRLRISADVSTLR